MSLWGKKKQISFKDELAQVVVEPSLEERVELLELEIQTLKEVLKEGQRKTELLEGIIKKLGGASYNNLTVNEKIYQAIDEGQDIVEIAKKFNKGKGEIELIRNLRNLK